MNIKYELRNQNQEGNKIMKIASQNTTSILLDKRLLKKLRLKAMRSGAWFSALLRIDRVLIDLTIRVTRCIRSATLAKNIFIIMKKLEEEICDDLSRTLRNIGVFFARKLSLLAQRWGNTSAKNWAYDLSYHRFLAVTHINDPRYLGHNRSYMRTCLH